MSSRKGARAAAGVAATAALWLLAASAFVAPGGGRSPRAALRGGRALDVRPFEVESVAPSADQRAAALSWASFASLFAALGLALGVAGGPARAVAEPGAPPAVEQAPVKVTAPEAAKRDGLQQLKDVPIEEYQQGKERAPQPEEALSKAVQFLQGITKKAPNMDAGSAGGSAR